MSLNAITPIDDLGVLHVSGADALDFLHRQLSNDFALLKHDAARLAAFLSPKGRMQASFIGVRYGASDVLLLAHRSVLAAVHKRLSMYVLRAKVRISDASAQWRLRGLMGDAIATAAALPIWAGSAASALPLQPWQAVASAAAVAGPAPDAAAGTAATGTTDQTASGAAWLIGLYPAGQSARALWISAAADAQALPPDTDAAVWAWSEAASGIATISQGVVDQFVPQMLNYESIGGVNFKKGCYPGQEVVARSQFRGAIKRRAYLAQGLATHLPEPGTEIFTPSDPQQPCGVLVQAAWQPQPAQPQPGQSQPGAGQPAPFAAIVSLKIAHAQEPVHWLHGGQALALRLDAVPYPLLEDI